jgi:hypothetical protein
MSDKPPRVPLTGRQNPALTPEGEAAKAAREARSAAALRENLRRRKAQARARAAVKPPPAPGG